jgi:uncharacterized protein YprB with RNaseH-like and TPR domain
VKPRWLEHLHESRKQHDARNPDYFYEQLPASCQWRLFADYRDSCAFLDIETTGLGWHDEITTIALYDGRTVRHYVQGDNLEQFLNDVQAYRLLVTYNGKSFDVPFIERFFHTRLPQAHIDLRHTLRSLGITGGLKACERHLGLKRPGLEEVDGFIGVLLWWEYRRKGNDRALETLLAYNIADTVNLEALMIQAYNLKLATTPFADTHRLAVPSTPASPFRADKDVIAKVLGVASRLGMTVDPVLTTGDSK